MNKKPTLSSIGVDELPSLGTRLPSAKEMSDWELERARAGRATAIEQYKQFIKESTGKDKKFWQKKLDDVLAKESALKQLNEPKPLAKRAELPEISESKTKEIPISKPKTQSKLEQIKQQERAPAPAVKETKPIASIEPTPVADYSKLKEYQIRREVGDTHEEAIKRVAEAAKATQPAVSSKAASKPDVIKTKSTEKKPESKPKQTKATEPVSKKQVSKTIEPITENKPAVKETPKIVEPTPIEAEAQAKAMRERFNQAPSDTAASTIKETTKVVEPTLAEAEAQAMAMRKKFAAPPVVEESKNVVNSIIPEGIGAESEVGRAVPKLVEKTAEEAVKPGLLKSILGKAKTFGSGVAKSLPYLAAATEAPQIVSDLSSGNTTDAAKHLSGAAGSFAGAELGAALGATLGPGGAVVGGIAGGYLGRPAVEEGFDYLKKNEQPQLNLIKYLGLPQSYLSDEKEQAKTEPLRRLEQLRDTAKTAEERGNLEQVIKRTKQRMAGVSDEDVLAGEEARQKELLSYKRPESVEQADRLVNDPNAIYSDFIGNVESNNNYNAVNKSSGAFGKYQILEKDIKGRDVHGKAVEQRYGMPFKEAMADPEKQEDYFNNVLLPQYKKDASELAKTPEAKEKGLDEFTLTGMMQLGKGNVINFLHDNVNNNIADQMYYFQGKADQYKRNLASEKADIGALKDKEIQWQEEGKYIPFKSAEAKMDTLRSGETTMTREEADALNQASKMRKQDDMQRSASFIPFKSAEDKMRTLEEQPVIQEKEPEVSSYAQKPDEIADIKEQQEVKPKSRLEAALELQRQYEMLAGISRGSERLGRGLAGAISRSGPSKMSEGEFEESLSRMGKTGVEGAKLLDEETLKQEESDPTSEKSMRARESLKSILGKDLPESLSYNDIKTLKFSDLSIKAGSAGAQQEKINTQRIDKLGKSLIAELQSRQQFGIDAKTLANVQNAEALLTGYKSLDDIPQAQVYEVARAVDRIVSQASPTISASKELTPETARSVLSKYISFASGQVTGAGVGEFLKNYRKLLQREKEQAQSRIKNVQTRIASPYLDLWERPEYKDRIKFIFEANGLDADSMFQTLEEKKQETLKDEKEQPTKPEIHSETGIELYD